MEEQRYSFQKLTPVKDQMYSPGAYSAGKSSVLESYKAKKPDKKFVHIFLAHFRTPEHEGGESDDIVKESMLEFSHLVRAVENIQFIRGLIWIL